MKNRALIFITCIVLVITFYSPPRAKADPLTIMAIVGVTAVLAAGSVDMVEHRSDEGNKDLHAVVREDSREPDTKGPAVQTEKSEDQLFLSAADQPSKRY